MSTFENPHYFRDLVVMFGRPNISNDEILGWIEVRCCVFDMLVGFNYFIVRVKSSKRTTFLLEVYQEHQLKQAYKVFWFICHFDNYCNRSVSHSNEKN